MAGLREIKSEVEEIFDECSSESNPQYTIGDCFQSRLSVIRIDSLKSGHNLSVVFEMEQDLSNVFNLDKGKRTGG